MTTARRVPLLRAMARDLEERGTIGRPAATAMWAGYLTHAAVTLRALSRPGARLPLPVRAARLAGAALAGAGVVLCAGGMGRFSGPRELSGTRAQPLTTTGIYRYSRNPQYLGYLVALTGAALAQRSGPALAFTAAMAGAYAAWIPVEEEHLTRQFGQQYVDYLDRTHRWWGRSGA